MKGFSWRKEKPNKGWVYPTSREGHTITYISKHDCILLFGGLSKQRTNDLYLYDIKENMWKQQPTNGRSPSARCYHSAFYDEDQDSYYIYGGQGDKGRSMGDFYYLSCKNWVWKKLFIQEIPPSRHHHIFSEMNQGSKERIIFGGICQPENQLLNDLWVFDYSNLIFSSSLQDISGAKCVKVTKTSGDQPSPRRGMCSFSIDRQLFLFGGECLDRDEETNFLYCLSYDTWSWCKIYGIGQPPPSRSFLSAQVFTNRRILFFGGADNETNKGTNELNILTLNDYYWSSSFQAGMKASPRYNHSSCVIDVSSNEKQLVILGGLDFTFCPMELCILYESETNENAEWERQYDLSELEQVTQEQAGLNIFDHKQDINELDNQISKQRQVSIQLEEQEKQLQDKQQQLEDEHKDYAGQLDQKLLKVNTDNEKYLKQMENLSVLIKQEQLYSKEIATKNKLLEYTINKVQDYLIPIDQFYQQISQMKYDEKDSKDMQLKQIVDSSKDEVLKSRELHKNSLYNLKKNYEKINTGIQKCGVDLEKNRKQIYNVNQDFEQIICETENEDNTINNN